MKRIAITLVIALICTLTLPAGALGECLTGLMDAAVEETSAQVYGFDAEIEDDFDYETIALGQTKTVRLSEAGDIKAFLFTAPSSGYYIIETTGSTDTLIIGATETTYTEWPYEELAERFYVMSDMGQGDNARIWSYIRSGHEFAIILSGFESGTTHLKIRRGSDISYITNTGTTSLNIAAGDVYPLRFTAPQGGYYLVGTPAANAVLFGYDSIDDAMWQDAYENYTLVGLDAGEPLDVLITSDAYTAINSTLTASRVLIARVTGNLRLRDRTSVTGNILTVIPKGANIGILGDQSNGFYPVYYDGKIGYASAQYITDVVDPYSGEAPTAQPTATPTVEPTLEPTPEPTSAPTQAPSAQPTTEPTSQPSAAPTPQPTTVPTTAPTPQPTTLYARVNTNATALNLRAQASTTSAIIGSIPRGTRLVVNYISGEWMNVSYMGVNGFVAARYMLVESAGQPTATPAPTSSAAGHATVRTGGSRLNLRRQPSTGSAVVTQIPNGAALTVLSTTGSWARVSYGSYTGYVMLSYITMSEAVTNTPAPSRTPAPTASGQTGRVTLSSGRLNVRAAPNTSAGVVMQLPNGATVDIVQAGTQWHFIRYGNQTGYVSAAYITLNDAPAAPTATPAAAPTENPTETPTSAPSEAPSAEPTEAPTAEPTPPVDDADSDEPTAAPTEAVVEAEEEPEGDK